MAAADLYDLWLSFQNGISAPFIEDDPKDVHKLIVPGCPDNIKKMFIDSPVINACWTAFKKFSKNRKELCRELRVNCSDINCKATTLAIYTAGDIRIQFCSNCYKHKDLENTLPSTFCHELIHHMNGMNCRFNVFPDPEPIHRDPCVVHMIDECQAYYCTGSCNSADSCLTSVRTSSKMHPDCGNRDPTPAQELELIKWFENAKGDRAVLCPHGINPAWF